MAPHGEGWEEEVLFFLRIMTIYDGFGANGSCLFCLLFSLVLSRGLRVGDTCSFKMHLDTGTGYWLLSSHIHFNAHIYHR